MKRRRMAAETIAAVAALVVLLVLLERLAAMRGEATDLFPRWYGLRELLLHHRNPYDPAISREVASHTWRFDGAASPDSLSDTLLAAFGFLYPLPGALLLAPLALVPYPHAQAGWLLLTVLALPASAWLAVRVAVAGAGAADARWAKLLALPMALLFLPALADLILAQPAALVTLLVALAVWLSTGERRWQPLAGGAALAGAAALKPHLLLLLAPLWLGFHAVGWWRGDDRGHRGHTGRRSRDFVVGAAAAACALTGSAFLLLPSWLPDFLAVSRAYYQVAPPVPAALAAAQAMLPGTSGSVLGVAAMIALVLWATYNWYAAARQRVWSGEAELECIGLTIVVGLLVVPPSWESNAVLLLIPLGLTLAHQRTFRRALLLVAGSILISAFDLPLFLSIGWHNGAVLTLAYAVLLAGFTISLVPSPKPEARSLGAGAGGLQPEPSDP